MLSKFATRCPHCGSSVPVGTEIAKRAGKWGHAICPQAHAPIVIGDAPSAPAPAKPFTPSAYQVAIFDWMREGDGHAVVEAVAGSGKTTTLVHALRFTDSAARVCFVAFNKHIADELKTRAPAHVTVRTLHALGYANLRRIFGKSKVDDRKIERIFDAYPAFKIPEQADPQERAELRLLRANMTRLIALTKATLTDPANTASLAAMIATYSLDLNGDEALCVRELPRLMSDCRGDTSTVNFDDMYWLPVTLGLELERFDWLFVDEAQDMSACQIEFIKRSIAPGGRVVAVGDRYQSLYAFRGADANAIPRMIEELAACVLPLSITYRCPLAQVRLAQTYVPHLEARPNAPEGEIAYSTADDFSPAAGDMVICRTNAPLIAPAFALIRKGVKATVRGRDIGANLAALAYKLTPEEGDMAGMYAALAAHEAKERRRLDGRKASEAQYQALEDKVNTLEAIMAECTEPAQVPQRIEAIFSDDSAAGVVFSSIHRAKGLEADAVYILRPDQLPMVRKNQTEADKQQEANCCYVAYTRSKSRLIFVEPPKKEVRE